MKNSYKHDPIRLWYLPMILGLIFIGPSIGMLATPVEFYVSRLGQSFGRLANVFSKRPPKFLLKDNQLTIYPK